MRIGDVVVAGACFPLKPYHVPFWRDEFRAYAETRLGVPTLLVGDWNTGDRILDAETVMAYGSPECAQMAAMGWRDAWRSLHPEAREYTWFSRKPHCNGFRIDHAFVSPPLASRLTAAHYDHRIRELGATDHSALVVELAAG
ncbi:MAG: hypothetical protein L3K06_05490 [Thermoplasmata archaeon]|nr:hypothetical protein [Thermoplasmata archaeon]